MPYPQPEQLRSRGSANGIALMPQTLALSREEAVKQICRFGERARPLLTAAAATRSLGVARISVRAQSEAV